MVPPPSPPTSPPKVRVPVSRKSLWSFPPPLQGRVQMETLESSVLRDNPLGDPATRTLAVYTPPSGRTEGLPLLVYLAGFTGAGWSGFQRPMYLGEPTPQRFERLLRGGGCPEAVIVAPDCLTCLGGSQYVNSSATGAYEDYVVREVVPWAREKFKTSRTGVLGQSSGGFGALHLSFQHPDVFAAAGSSSGDMAFEYCYLPDFPKAVREFRRGGGPEGFLEKLFQDPRIMKGALDSSGAALNALAMAACYSPRGGEPGAFDLPFDPENGLLLEEVWKRWLAFDPVRRVVTSEGREALRKLRRVHITASAPDEWTLDVGARTFTALAKTAGVRVEHQEFEGGHGAFGPRFDALYPSLLQALVEP